jgi:hypothetical protein
LLRVVGQSGHLHSHKLDGQGRTGDFKCLFRMIHWSALWHCCLDGKEFPINNLHWQSLFR